MRGATPKSSDPARHADAPGRPASGARRHLPPHFHLNHLTVSLPHPANRLAREKSPYLLQHQHNPVDWYAWGEEAFAAARNAGKPIFLSIGYSTCHWCHVMERESFEDPDVAAFLNAHFISIKVDREERPDVDQIYMTFVQATTGAGGWPLNVFLTPSLQPFYGGTYFPPSGRPGRPGFLDVLGQLREVWQERRGEVTGSAAEMRDRLAAYVQHEPAGEAVLQASLLAVAAEQLKADYDPRHGGFGGAPKFPRPVHPAFLLRWARRSGDLDAVRMVLHTCDRMAAGGLCDQLGGGFARYSVDAEWLVPHFEKMLYDNAQLAQLYLDAHLVSGELHHAAVVRGVLDYVLRDMTHPGGGFYSAEDADSEGKEGRFYCWTLAEMRSLLSGEECAVATRHFGVTARGNFVDHSDPEPLPGQNVLSVVDPQITPAEASLLASARGKLLAARTGRVRPHLDDKILASGNGLMLGAFARAGRVLGEPKYLAAARRNLEFLQAHLWEPASRTLYHRWRDGERDSVQLLDGYTFLLAGVLDLYEATLEPDDLAFAVALADSALARFHDPLQGGFWQSGAVELILRIKEDYDGAEPSGNSVAALALLRLAEITGRKDFGDAAQGTLRLFASRMRQTPQAVPYLMSALDFWVAGRSRIVIAGTPGDPRFEALLDARHRVFAPNQVVLGNAAPAEPFACSLPAQDGAVAYLCTGNTCQPPITDPAELIRQLRS